MSPPTQPSDSLQGHFLVATSDNVVYCRVVGMATMNNSISCKTLLEHLQKKSFYKFVFDFSECHGFDSTFMGILLGLALGASSVVAVNLKAPQKKLLEEVGIHRVINLCVEPVDLPDVSLQRVEQKPVEPRARIEQILEAHENLIRLDPSNQEIFGTFIENLRKELGDGSPL